MRLHEAGWILLCMHDPVGRRGIWARTAPATGEGATYVPARLELCAGREGDDVYVVLDGTEGAVENPCISRSLRDLLDYATPEPSNGVHDEVRE